MKVAVSYLKSDNYKKCIEQINLSKADFIHVDLCDGKYVETKNFTISEVTKLLSISKKELDIHLMVKEPMKYLDDLALLNICTITIHIEACKNPQETIDYIKSMGLKVGIAINPDQDIKMIMPYIEQIDSVLVMTVVPGKGGQAFIEDVLPKFDKLNILKEKYNFIIAADGGINNETIGFLKEKEVDLVVSGSYITNSEDFDEAINNLK